MDAQIPQNQIQMASFPPVSFPRTQFNPAQFNMSFQQPPQQPIQSQAPTEQVENAVSLPGPLGPFNDLIRLPIAQAKEVASEPKQKQPGLFGKFFSGLFNKTINVDNRQANMSNFATPLSNTSTPQNYDTKVFDIKPRETNKLVSLLVAEAGDEGKEGMQAVLNTMINRTQVNPKYYGKNIWDVITKDGQYTAFSVNNPHYVEVKDFYDNKGNVLTPGREKQIQEAQQLIDLAKSGQLQDLTSGATHYWNPDSPTFTYQKWMDNTEPKGKIGNHVFAYSKS